jgi:Na+/H+-dicarboxylate symporter
MPVARKPLYTSLFVQVLAALLLGIVLGMAVPEFAVSLKIFSDAFLKLISMIVAPIMPMVTPAQIRCTKNCAHRMSSCTS